MNPIQLQMNQNGLERVSGKIMANLRNAVSLRTGTTMEDQLEPGRSKIGGRPDLPAGVEWPVFNAKHLSFIAQLNLTEIAPHDTEQLLPATGTLYFFYDAEQEAWGFDPVDSGGWKVIYFNGDPHTIQRTDFPADIPEYARYEPCRIECNNEPSLPAWDSVYMDELNLSEEECDAYLEIVDVGYDDCYHKLLGHPRQIQGDMQLECQLVSNGLYCGDSSGYEDPKRVILEKSVKDWRLLLEIDSDDNAAMMWGDSGRIYFWIQDEDLKKRQFDKVWSILQCY
jgi:Uncharacterized protein conserved in bacteria